MAHSAPDQGSNDTATASTSLAVEDPPQTPDDVVATRPLLGCDADGRRHYISNPDQLVYVLAPEDNVFEYVYDLSAHSLRSWVDYVGDKSGWDHLWPVPRRHRVAEDPPEAPSPEDVKRFLLGIDEDGYRHYLKQPGDWLFVFEPDAHEVVEVYDLSAGNVQTWVEQVAGATGWADLRYSDKDPFERLAEQLAEALQGDGDAEDGERAAGVESSTH